MNFLSSPQAHPLFFLSLNSSGGGGEMYVCKPFETTVQPKKIFSRKEPGGFENLSRGREANTLHYFSGNERHFQIIYVS